jgi:hypothetical protein
MQKKDKELPHNPRIESAPFDLPSCEHGPISEDWAACWLQRNRKSELYYNFLVMFLK